ARGVALACQGIVRVATDVNGQDWQILSTLLDQALELPAERRVSWVDGLGPPYDVFRERLRKLLAHHAAAETGDFLRTLPNLTVLTSSDVSAETIVAAARVVGPYRLIRELGRGGMGRVWLAERIDGLIKRPVALKLPHPGIADATLQERFAREREILGALSHPHIARLHDVRIARGPTLPA